MEALLVGSLLCLWAGRKPMRCFSIRKSWVRVMMPCRGKAESALRSSISAIICIVTSLLRDIKLEVSLQCEVIL